MYAPTRKASSAIRSPSRWRFMACAVCGGSAGAGRGGETYARLGGRFFAFEVAAFATLGAVAEHAHRVVRQLKLVLGGDLVLQRFHVGGVELDGLAAGGADQMIVVRVLVVVLVARASVA